MSTAFRTYRFELRPTSAQRGALERTGHARRFAFNWALGRWREHYRDHGTSPDPNDLMRHLAEMKRAPGFEWLADVNAQILQQAVCDVRRAYTNFFERRARYPRFKSRKRDPLRFRVPQHLVLDGERLFAPKLGWIRLCLSRPVAGEIRSATFKRSPEGRWFVAILTRFEAPTPQPVSRAARVVGVDLGLAAFAVMSDGLRIAPEGRRQLVAAGHADTSNACGAQVRPPMEARGDEAGTPAGMPKRFDSG
jgi:putative transposase